MFRDYPTFINCTTSILNIPPATSLRGTKGLLRLPLALRSPLFQFSQAGPTCQVCLCALCASEWYAAHNMVETIR